MADKLPETAIAEVLAGKIAALRADTLPPAVRRKCEALLIDVVGLCVTVRNADYINAAIAAWDDEGPCTPIGHGGIIEYLAEGAWTKRLHPGWAAQSGLRAALLGRAGFVGPRTVFEGVHGFFHGFANTTEGDYDAIKGDFGKRWVTETLAFKPYPCGTMTHPYIDCARRLAAKGIKASDIKEMVCEVGEGTVHRLWEPLASKTKPANR